jgi:HlyD family secretion protein
MNRITRTVSARPRLTIAVLLVLAILIGFGVFGSTDETPKEAPNNSRIPSVTLATPRALITEAEPLVLLGEVRSTSEAELRTQKSGEVVRVNVAAGQFVGAGTILAEIENASERASLLSAQGAVAAAEATLQKTRAGARSEDRQTATAAAEAAAIALAQAEESARSAFSQAYSLAQDAVYARADDFFTDPFTARPSFRIRTANVDESTELEKVRVELGDMLEAWQAVAATTIPSNELDTRLSEAQRDLEKVKAFVNRINGFVAEQEVDVNLSSSAKSAQEATISAAVTGTDSARSVVVAAVNGLASARSANTSASFSESKLVVGERPEDIAAAEAAVLQAQGSLASARAAFENSVIRTPIAGTVKTLAVTRGDFVQAFESAAIVANDGGVLVEAFVSSDAKSRIAVGDAVLVSGTMDGTVSTIEPGLDPVQKKSRVTIAVADEASALLTHGEFVEVAILKGGEERTAIDTTRGIPVPITAVKVLPAGLVVFTVEDNRLQALSVTEGPIIGTAMFVAGENISLETRIVTDARGLSEGDEVVVNEQ